jgi:hypothetical protein
MRMVFDLDKYQGNKLDSDNICEEVTMVGFSAELIEMIENNPEELLARQNSIDTERDLEMGRRNS